MPEETENTEQTTQNENADSQIEETSAEENQQEETFPKYEYQAEDVGTLKKKVTVTVPRERISAKQDEMFGELGDTAQIPGFRIGHAPRRLVEKRFGKEVSTDVRNALIGEALGEVLKEADFKTLGEPDLDLEKIELPEKDAMEFSFEVEVAPEFSLPELTGIAVEQRVFEATDERVTEYVDQLRQGRAKFEETENAAEEGDVIVADTKVSAEGVDPVEHKDRPIRVAPGQVEGLPLVDLAKEITGKKTGDSVTITVQAPQAHPNEDWRGKEMTVELVLTKVRKRIMPEIDEEFAKTMGFDSLDELREFVGERMKERMEGDSKRALRDQVCSYLADNTDFELPEGVAARHAAQTLQRHYVDLLQKGMPREKIEENLTELKAAADKQSAQDLKLQFIVAKIAETEGLEVSEDEINSRIAQMAGMYNRRPERMRHDLEQDGSITQVETQLAEEKVIDKLLEQAKITEVAHDEAEQTDENEKAK